MQLRFIFREPVFPMVANINGHFIGAATPADLLVALSRINLAKDKLYDMVDGTGEGWSLYVPKMIISPLSVKKRWTKREVIKLFNERKNTETGGGRNYSEKSLSAKRLDKIISDLAKLSVITNTKANTNGADQPNSLKFR